MQKACKSDHTCARLASVRRLSTFSKKMKFGCSATAFSIHVAASSYAPLTSLRFSFPLFELAAEERGLHTVPQITEPPGGQAR
jgi:hypothetical protein